MKLQAALACVCWFIGSTLHFVHSGAILKDLGLEDQIRSYIEDSFRDGENFKVETDLPDYSYSEDPEDDLGMTPEPECPVPDCPDQCGSGTMLAPNPLRPECLTCVCQPLKIIDPGFDDYDLGDQNLFKKIFAPGFDDSVMGMIHEPECPVPVCPDQCGSGTMLTPNPSKPPECLMCVCQPLLIIEPEDFGVEFVEPALGDYIIKPEGFGDYGYQEDHVNDLGMIHDRVCPVPDCPPCGSHSYMKPMPSGCMKCVCPADWGHDFGGTPEPECPPPVCPETCEYENELEFDLMLDPTNPDCLLCVCPGKKESPLLPLDR